MKKLSEQEQKQLKNEVEKLFSKFDKNQNHKLEKEELRNFIFTKFSLVANLGEEMEKEVLENVFQNILKNFDLNNDGIVKKDELLEALQKGFM